MKDILTEKQIAFLKAVGKNKYLASKFYLTGGTPLAAFYLHHRYSEDLDFFSTEEVDPAGINVFLQKNKKTLGIKTIDYEQSYNRNLFFVRFPDSVLKTEFTYFPFQQIEKAPNKYEISVDSLLDIAVNKLFTIYQRTQARDYIDLYCICQTAGYTIRDLIKKARIKFDWHIDPIQLGAQFIKSTKVSDYPVMILNVAPNKWQEFFINEAKKFRKEILE